MMIYKYTLTLGANKVVTFAGAEILSFQIQGDDLCIWALVDTSKPSKAREILVVGTGQEVSGDLSLAYHFIGTAQAGPFVWHCFDITPTA